MKHRKTYCGRDFTLVVGRADYLPFWQRNPAFCSAPLFTEGNRVIRIVRNRDSPRIAADDSIVAFRGRAGRPGN